MAKGRKPVPSVVKQLRGTDQKCRMNADEPEFEAPALVIPGFLDEEARNHYVHLHSVLSAAKVLTQADIDCLIQYCAAWSIWREATEAIKTHGCMIKDPESGLPRASPWLRVQRDSISACQKYMTELGITPASRTRVKVTGKPEAAANPFLNLARKNG